MGQSISQLDSKESQPSRTHHSSFRKRELQNTIKAFDISNSNNNQCSFLAFCSESTEKINWRSCLKNDCKELLPTYEWASLLPEILAKFKGLKDEYFQSELPRTLFRYNGNFAYFPLDLCPEKFVKSMKAHNKTLETRSKTEQVKSLGDLLNDEVIESSLLRSSLRDRHKGKTEGFELYKSMVEIPAEASDKHSYYQNNTILNIEENLTRSTNETEEKPNLLYKAVMQMIEKHLDDKQHPLNFLLNYFIDYFIGKVESDSCQKEEFSEKEVQSLMDESKAFMGLMRNAIYIFYNFSELGFKIKKTFGVMVNLFTFDNLTNFVTSFFFHKFEIYDVLFDLLCRLDLQKDEILQKNLKVLKTWGPSDFGVSEAFTLDFINYRFLQKKHKTKVPFSRLQTKSVKLANEGPRNELQRASTSMQTPKDLLKTTFAQDNHSGKTDRNLMMNPEEEASEVIEYQPFAKATEKLNLLVQLKSPLQQLKALHETFECVIQSISDFYGTFNVTFDKFIESDDIISLLLYVISQGSLPNLHSHIKIIDNFITTNYMYNIIGYQFVTLKACLNYIENINEIEHRKDQKYSVSELKKSILLDLKKEADTYDEKKTFII